MEGRNTGENRKVFFLHPQAVVQDELVRALITDNYETYLIRNHVSAKAILRRYPDSVLLAQVDSGLDEQKWKDFAGDLKANPLFSELTLCVLSVSSIDRIRSSFLGQSSAFSCGFSYGKYDFAATYLSIKEMLEQEKVNPRNFTVKATCPAELKASVVFTKDQIRFEGSLGDISISGLTCRIDGPEPLYPSEFPIPRIIISYKKSQLTVSGRIVGSHGKDNDVYLILFDNAAEPDKKEAIYDLVHACLQAHIDAIASGPPVKSRYITKIPRTKLYRK